MNRTTPAETKLTICVWHPFSEWRPPASLADAILSRWPAMRVVHLPNFDRLPQELPDTDIFVGYSLRPNQFPAARKLKWIHSTATGVAQLAYPELRDSGILVTNPSGLFSVPMAEHAMGLLVALARNFPDSVRHQDRAIWSQQILWDKAPITELNGKILLIVGYGSIGRELARRAAAFDMSVWGVSRSGTGDTTHAEKIAPVSQFRELLPHADYIVISAPETPETFHLIGAQELSLLKPSAFLINLARGSLLDQTAFIAALRENKLAGAALDVTDPEPPPPSDPIWKAPNLFITPHTSAISDRLWPRETSLLLDLLERWFDGRELFNLVDLHRGY
ncbi:MAG TPA: D-2-hydroxyacid dehydrogenase [Candidatus Eisenbacteria bacterium]|nr:D-2-hydroxyacid dehydrogenase [Candidatus Eisenbacteria bacterium]